MDSLTQVDFNQEQSMMYLYKWLLSKMDWYYRASDDGRFLEKWIERERQIEKLRQLIDPNNIIYNQFSPYKK